LRGGWRRGEGKQQVVGNRDLTQKRVVERAEGRSQKRGEERMSKTRKNLRD